MYVLHCDLDSFFASVEQAVRPETQGRELAVCGGGAKGKFGMVVAASYPAKALGIKVGTPGFSAMKMAPEIELVRARMSAYSLVGERVREIIASCGAPLYSVGMDECFLDMKDVDPEFIKVIGNDDESEAFALASWIKERVWLELGVRLSIGGGSNKVVAKLASKRCKPDGLLLLDKWAEDEFLFNCPVGEIFGVGGATLAKLNRLGVTYVKDLKEISLASLVSLTGKHTGQMLYLLGRNELITEVSANKASKSLSVTKSLGMKGGLAAPALEEVLNRLVARFVDSKASAQGVHVFARGEVNSCEGSVGGLSPTRDAAELTAFARAMIERVPEGLISRYVGIGFSGLSEGEQFRLDVKSDVLSVDRYFRPVKDVRASQAERFLDSAYFNMPVKHKLFGEGRVVKLGKESVFIEFSGVVRELEGWAPVTF